VNSVKLLQEFSNTKTLYTGCSLISYVNFMISTICARNVHYKFESDTGGMTPVAAWCDCHASRQCDFHTPDLQFDN